MSNELKVNAKTDNLEFKRKHNKLVDVVKNIPYVSAHDILHLTSEDFENIKLGENLIDVNGQVFLFATKSGETRIFQNVSRTQIRIVAYSGTTMYGETIQNIADFSKLYKHTITATISNVDTVFYIINNSADKIEKRLSVTGIISNKRFRIMLDSNGNEIINEGYKLYSLVSGTLTLFMEVSAAAGFPTNITDVVEPL